MSDMFCFQCQQTAGNTVLRERWVSAASSRIRQQLQDELVYELIRLGARPRSCGRSTPHRIARPAADGRPVHHA